MKFKVGDEVRIIDGVGKGFTGVIERIEENDTVPYRVEGNDDFYWKREENLKLADRISKPMDELNKLIKEEMPPCEELPFPGNTTLHCEDLAIRKFETGATRDTALGKLSYMKALSPEVLEAYVMYLDKHRKQSDGSMREFDNWKLGIDKWTYLDCLLRHDHATWMLMLGYAASDNHGPVTLLDSLMAIIFNASGLAYELLIEEGKAKRCEQSS